VYGELDIDCFTRKIIEVVHSRLHTRSGQNTEDEVSARLGVIVQWLFERINWSVEEIVVERSLSFKHGLLEVFPE
jgi:hypothetical protein